MTLVDVHLHSRFSFDSDETQSNYIKKAKKMGAGVLGFCEHFDYDAYLYGDDIGLCDLDTYFETIDSLRVRHPDIKILAGVEFGYSEKAEDKYIDLERKYPFDYVVMSVHTLPKYGDFFNGKVFEDRTLNGAYDDYLSAVLKSVLSPAGSDIIAHIGYPERYCEKENSSLVYSEHAEIFDSILTAIIETGKCLEINTSTAGLEKDFFPDTSVLDRYIELGGKKFSFGSDAHSAQRFMDKADAVKTYLTSRGIEKMRYFEARKQVEYSI
ncbi:MAG: histidinol-phosphatase HisJ family protein [Clostridia bacterium]|nr:histidinol-phosphatase HisJ family protein [Clostridia bacterium]